MSWEDNMVNLVKKLSKEVKQSPNYNERKKQMLEERREYIKQEKMRRKSFATNTASILSGSQGNSHQRPKTAQNRVSFADDNCPEKEIQLVQKNSLRDSSSQSCDLDDSVAASATKCMGTSTNDINSSYSGRIMYPSKTSKNLKNHDGVSTASTKSFGTSTDDIESGSAYRTIYTTNKLKLENRDDDDIPKVSTTTSGTSSDGLNSYITEDFKGRNNTGNTFALTQLKIIILIDI